MRPFIVADKQLPAAGTGLGSGVAMDGASFRGSLCFPSRLGLMRVSGRRAVLVIGQGAVSLDITLIAALAAQPVIWKDPPGIDFGRASRGGVAARPRGDGDWHYFRCPDRQEEVLAALERSGAAYLGEVSGPPGLLDSPPVRGPWPWLFLGAGLAFLLPSQMLPPDGASWLGSFAPAGLAIGGILAILRITSWLGHLRTDRQS